MNRFFKEATTGSGNVVLLDGRPMKTPAQATLALPSLALARAIAEEWNEQGDPIKTETLHLTRLASTAIDRTTILRDHIVHEILAYGKSDLLAYRAEAPAELTARQSAAWNPILDWLKEAHGAHLATGQGINHIPQSDADLVKLEHVLRELDDWQLTALQSAVAITGSLVLGLALVEGRVTAAQAFTLSRIDEAFQAEKWGKDIEAEKRARQIAHELARIDKFIALAKT